MFGLLIQEDFMLLLLIVKSLSSSTIGVEFWKIKHSAVANYDPVQGNELILIIIAAIAVLIASCLNDATAVSCDSFRYPKIYVYLTPYNSPGEYIFSKEYNGAPVYKKDQYSIYGRNNGYWHLDNNAISEEYDGTVYIIQWSVYRISMGNWFNEAGLVLLAKAVFVYGGSHINGLVMVYMKQPSSVDGRYSI